MKHEITPWSIYEQNLSKFGQHSLQQKLENKQLRLVPQQHFYDKKHISSIKSNISRQEEKIERGLNSIIYLELIRRELQLSTRNQLELPEINGSFHVNRYQIRNLRLNKKNQSKLSNYTDCQRNGQQLDDLKYQQSKINVLNYNPFDHAQIIQRGLIQVMKIRKRINKSQLKDNHSFHQI